MRVLARQLGARQCPVPGAPGAGALGSRPGGGLPHSDRELHRAAGNAARIAGVDPGGAPVPRRRLSREQEALVQAIRADEDLVAERLRGRTISDLVNAPPIVDRRTAAAVEMLGDTIPLTGHSAIHARWLTLQGLKLCLEHGHVSSAPVIYVFYAVQLASVPGSIQRALAFSDLAVALDKRYGDLRWRPAVLCSHAGAVHPWGRPFRLARAFFDEAFATAQLVWDRRFAPALGMVAVWTEIEAGDPIPKARAAAKRYLDFTARVGSFFSQLCRQYVQFLACLEGQTPGLAQLRWSRVQGRGSSHSLPQERLWLRRQAALDFEIDGCRPAGTAGRGQAVFGRAATDSEDAALYDRRCRSVLSRHDCCDGVRPGTRRGPTRAGGGDRGGRLPVGAMGRRLSGELHQSLSAGSGGEGLHRRQAPGGGAPLRRRHCLGPRTRTSPHGEPGLRTGGPLLPRPAPVPKRQRTSEGGAGRLRAVGRHGEGRSPRP